MQYELLVIGVNVFIQPAISRSVCIRNESTSVQLTHLRPITLNPAGAHTFHKHPKQEEVIYVIEGEIEEWVDGEKQTLREGDSAFIPPDVVHASFNRSDRNARLLAILGPCGGAEGYELVDVANQEPWVSLKASDHT